MIKSDRVKKIDRAIALADAVSKEAKELHDELMKPPVMLTTPFNTVPPKKAVKKK
jgi:hypothetical protein